jgi:16S rRNA (guanine527-N7)-methyltransferase
MDPRMAGRTASDGEAFRAALSRHAASWSVPCEPAQAEAITIFASLLLTWTARINLTGAVSLEELASDHLPDSFALASRLSDAVTVQALDVGSGGGLPALPLAVLCPNLSLRLLEPIAKKAAFLRTAVRELGLGERVTVDTRRAQTLVPGAFDVALSRATLPPRSWLPLAAELVRPGGRVFLLASGSADWTAPPAGLSSTGQWPYLAERRWLVELVKAHS